MELVYVLNINGQPLMPTTRYGKVRRLLKSGLAKAVKRCPFTIQLLYETGNHVQEITLGVDAGSKGIGLSATTETQEMYAGNVRLRQDITNLISKRKELRRTRRNRLRYRPARYKNRIKSKHKGWLAPTTENKIGCHLKVIENVCKLLPIAEIIVEVASFDIQKIKNPQISGKEYQEGEQLDFWNTREYIFARDEHVCQCCKGKSQDKVLELHHIESRKTGGNAPNNLITLCRTCHTGYHRETVKLPSCIKRGMSFRDAAFMNIMRPTVYERLKEIYPNVKFTYGYITKHARISNGLSKSHCVDARCISGHPLATPLGHYYEQRKIRCHNRKIHKEQIKKGGKKIANQAPFIMFGFRLFDKVLYKGKEYFISSRRSSGYFALRDFDGNKIDGVGYKKLKLIEKRKYYITEKKEGAPSIT